MLITKIKEQELLLLIVMWLKTTFMEGMDENYTGFIQDAIRTMNMHD